MKRFALLCALVLFAVAPIAAGKKLSRKCSVGEPCPGGIFSETVVIDASGGGEGVVEPVFTLPTTGAVIVEVTLDVIETFDGNADGFLNVGVADGDANDPYPDDVCGRDNSERFGYSGSPATVGSTGWPFHFDGTFFSRAVGDCYGDWTPVPMIYEGPLAIIATWTNTASATAGKVRVTIYYIPLP